MIRYTALWLFVSGLMAHAWRDWCKSLCVLIMLLGVLERPDMPKEIFGIRGLNPFNVALAGILLAWATQSPRERGTWDVPRSITVLFVMYVLVMAMSTLRMFVDPSYLLVWQSDLFPPTTRGALFAEYAVNTFKWLIPAILLVQGCRGEERHRLLIIGVLVVYAVLAILVIKQMPLGYLLDGERLQQRAADILQRRVGYHRVDLATMFAGAAWAMLAARPMFSSALVRLGLVGLSGVVVLGLALTGGRMGYATWCVVGLALCVLKWRRYLVLAPVALLIVLWFAPGITERMLQGFGDEGRGDQHLITSGRNLVWPYVLGKIAEGPLTGFGRQAWVRTNLRYEAAITTGEAFGHPHNAYFEFALDNGIIGLCVLLPLFGVVLVNAARLFRMRGNPAAEAAGGTALALTLAYVVAAFGAQTFYPTEGAVGMWCLIALATRVAREAAPVSDVMPAPAPRRAWRQPREVPRSWPARPLRGAPPGGLRGAQRVRR